MENVYDSTKNIDETIMEYENYLENGTFIHFYNNKYLCSKFVEYVTGLKYIVNHTCCNGTGCKINNIDDTTAYKIKQQFLHNNNYNN